MCKPLVFDYKPPCFIALHEKCNSKYGHVSLHEQLTIYFFDK